MSKRTLYVRDVDGKINLLSPVLYIFILMVTFSITLCLASALFGVMLALRLAEFVFKAFGL